MVNRTVEVDEKGWAALHKKSHNSANVPEEGSTTLRVQKLGKGSEEYVHLHRML